MNAMSPNFPTKFMVWCMGAGFILQGCATFCSHFFAADAKALSEVAAQVQQNSVQIAETKEVVKTDVANAIKSGDTSILKSEPTKTETPKTP